MNSKRIKASQHFKTIHFEINPEYQKGIVFSDSFRLFIFARLPGYFSIDFVKQELAELTICFVPPNHIYHLSNAELCDFICLDIKENVLQNQNLILLYSFFFQQQKVLKIDSWSRLNYQDLIGIISKNPTEEILIEEMNFELLRLFHKYKDDRNLELCNMQRLSLAIGFLQLIWTKQSLKQKVFLSEYARQLCCSEKSLTRACHATFGVSPSIVNKYYTIHEALYLLCNTDKTIASVAKELGYDVHSFSKLIKNFTRETPKKFRKRFAQVFFLTNY